jgi:undecaprenyl-diphosphatase
MFHCERLMNPQALRALENPIPKSFGAVPMAPKFRPLRQAFGPQHLPVTIRPTDAGLAIARTVARETGPAPQRLARALTWGADEKVLLALTAIGWLASRGAGEPMRRAASHAVLLAVAASLLPHGMKRLFDQIRPDRTTVVGHLHGVSFSGKREDAFPSGHALHMGALASAAGALPAGPRRVVRTLAIGLSLTRVAVLAHWASDVVAGFAVGMALERFLRCWTGFPQQEVHSDPEPKGNPATGSRSRDRKVPDDRVRGSISGGRLRGVGVFDAR